MWGRLSGGNSQLTLDEFFYCYRPHHIASSKGTYHFNAREKSLRLVSNMLDTIRRNGQRCPMVILTTLGLLSGIQVNPVNHVPFVFVVTLLNILSLFSFQLIPVPT